MWEMNKKSFKQTSGYKKMIVVTCLMSLLCYEVAKTIQATIQSDVGFLFKKDTKRTQKGREWVQQKKHFVAGSDCQQSEVTILQDRMD